MDLVITEKVNAGGEEKKAQNTFSPTDENVRRVTASIADGQTDKQVNFTCDVSQLVALYIHSDQDVTLETNDGTTPDDTISLKAGIPYVWFTNKYDSCLLTADVTALYVTNSSGSTANLTIFSAEDATP